MGDEEEKNEIEIETIVCDHTSNKSQTLFETV